MTRVWLLVGLLVAVPVQAELYKWTDAQGRVHFTDKKPEGNGKVETLKTPQRQSQGGDGEAASATRDSTSVLDRQKRMADILAQEREQREAAEAKKRKDEVARQQKCHEARDYRRNADGARLYDINQKGERVYMDDKAHAAHMRELDQAIKDLCR